VSYDTKLSFALRAFLVKFAAADEDMNVTNAPVWENAIGAEDRSRL
jgi:hypothetical protein